MKLFRTLAATLAVAGSIASTQAITIGDDAINRSKADGYSNFSMALLTEVVPAGGGYINEWSTYIKRGPGVMALLFLEDLGANNYEVKFVDEQDVNVGLNTFSASGFLDAGWIMGIWMGNAKVAFDYVGDEDTTYTANNLLGNSPAVGQTVGFTGRLTDRVYSINATVPDSGATLALLGLGLVGLVGLRRKFD